METEKHIILNKTKFRSIIIIIITIMCILNIVFILNKTVNTLLLKMTAARHNLLILELDRVRFEF